MGELAVVTLLPHTLSPTDTATLMLALRTSLPLVQPRPSRVCRSSQLFRAARTCLATLPLRRTLVDAQTRLVRLSLLGCGEARAGRDASLSLISFLSWQ